MADIVERARILADRVQGAPPLKIPSPIVTRIKKSLYEKGLWSISDVTYRLVDDFKRDPFGQIEEYGDQGLLKGELHDAVSAFLDWAEVDARRFSEIVVASMPMIQEINELIAKRTEYGMREEIATKPSTVWMWYNSSASWARYYIIVRAGQKVRLDANMILVPYPEYKVQPIAGVLDKLPLYAFSYEAQAKRRKKWEGIAPEMGQREVIDRLRAKGSQLVPPVTMLSAFRKHIATGRVPPGIVATIFEMLAPATYNNVANVIENFVFNYPPIVGFGRAVLED